MTNIVFFVLTGSLIDAVILLMVTVTSWVWISDYFFGAYTIQHPWLTSLLDRYAYMAISTLCVGVLASAHRYRLGSLRAPDRTSDLAGNDAIQVMAWKMILDELRGRATHAGAKRFLRWLTDRLDALSRYAWITPAKVSRCWWWRPRSIVRVWLVATWLPILWLVLFFLPRCTNAMETLASLCGSSRVHMFDVIVTGLEPMPPGTRIPMRITESIYRQQFPLPVPLRRTITAIVTNGDVFLRVNDVPRTSFRIKAICGGEKPGCSVAANADAPLGPQTEVPVRGGWARVHVIQRIPEPRLGLRLWLLRRDGVLVNELVIEP